jgi:hypothetical protein
MSTEPRRTNHSPRLERQREWWAQEQGKATDPAEIVEATTPLTEKQAKTLDTRIRLMVGSISDQLDKLAGLIAEAKAGQIHIALGHRSWTAYLADVVQIGSHDRDERRKIVALLSGEGMSQRAIAAAVGVSQKTVDRDIGEVVSHDDSVESEPVATTGLNGKTYQRKPQPAPDSEPRRRPPFTDRIADVRRDVDKLAQRIERLRGDDRYPKYREDFDREVGGAVARLVETVAPNLTATQRNRITTAVLRPASRADVDA